MGWIIAALAALLVLGVLAIIVPSIFGPALGGLAPLLVVIAVIGIGGVWWRHSRSRVEPEGTADEPAEDLGRRDLAEDERVET